MSNLFALCVPPAGLCLPYADADAGQRAYALLYLCRRLSLHFPAMQQYTLAKALVDYQPNLWVDNAGEIALAELDLTQLAQHLATSPELPVLSPPVYGLPALHLAQYNIQTSELGAWVLPEIVSTGICGPRLYALLQHLVTPCSLASQVVQAWCWNLPSAPPLLPGLPGGDPGPGSAQVAQWLAKLGRLSGYSTAALSQSNSPVTAPASIEQAAPSSSPDAFTIDNHPTLGPDTRHIVDVKSDTEQLLRRVSYWARKPVGWLMNEALAQLLPQYPEAAQPLPEE